MKAPSRKISLRIPTPRKFAPLLRPARYKGASGGRGSGKSHFFAERLVEDAVAEHIRAACVREFQSSIKDSVKQLIEDKIAALGVATLFRSTETEIRGPHDSLFVFRGLRTAATGNLQTAATIKSSEGFNRAWIEEAQTISRTSLDILTPTFRNNSELWFSWNPRRPTDPVDRLFRENEGDPDFIHVEANYRDNPWFPEELRRDMERDKSRDPDKYAHVWLGGYERLSEAAVFRNWRVEAFETPPNTRFYFGADWGFSIDPSVLIRCWLHGRTLYVDYEAYQIGCEVDFLPALFDKVPESRKWPIIADSQRPDTISYMQRHGFPRMTEAVKGPGSVEDGIEFLKNYDIVVHPRCVHTADELALYSYKLDAHTQEVLPQLADKHNHVIDSLRYALEGVRRNKPIGVSEGTMTWLRQLDRARAR